ncbi:peroxiredoxin [Staphylococcus parequorum]|uniref:peroxiredoxin n=1 Tax=Staphylococcus sp. S9 TaxID=3135640 RepID=UPI003A82E28E
MPLNSDLHSETQRLPRIGEKAPFFKGQSTQGEITLDDYKNDWVLLFAHPADFTPVCTSEFVALQNQYSEFQDLGVKLVGLSVDSLASHVAWLNSIEESFDVQIEFPLISDSNKVISETYGMLAPESHNTESSRAVFIIDDDAVVRAMIYYPMTTGRNIDELLRVTRAIKISDETGDNTPDYRS